MSMSPELRRARRAQFNRERRMRDRKNYNLVQAREGNWLVVECPVCSRYFDVSTRRPIPDCCPDCQ